MGGPVNGRSVPALCLAWPTAEIGKADPFGAIYDHNAFDDVIDPVETRGRILRMLRHLPRRLDQPSKKHPIDTW